MKILFIGEYSNVHATLALGLRQLGLLEKLSARYRCFQSTRKARGYSAHAKTLYAITQA